MSFAIAVRTLVGIGCIGMIRGLRSEPPTLRDIAATLDHWPDTGVAPTVLRAARAPGHPDRPDRPVHPGRPSTRFTHQDRKRSDRRVPRRSALTRGRWRSLDPSFAITGDSPDQIASNMLDWRAGLLAPPSLWLASQVAGLTAIPFGMPVVVAVVATPIGFASQLSTS